MSRIKRMTGSFHSVSGKGHLSRSAPFATVAFPTTANRFIWALPPMNLFSAPVQAPCSGRYALLAGMAGLEPANAGVKVPCLTTWLHPNISEARAGADAPALSHSMGWVMGLEPTTPGTTIRCSAN